MKWLSSNFVMSLSSQFAILNRLILVYTLRRTWKKNFATIIFACSFISKNRHLQCVWKFNVKQKYFDCTFYRDRPLLVRKSYSEDKTYKKNAHIKHPLPTYTNTKKNKDQKRIKSHASIEMHLAIKCWRNVNGFCDMKWRAVATSQY